MHLPWTATLLPVALLLTTASANDSDYKGICKNIPSCSTGINFPVGVKVKKCGRIPLPCGLDIITKHVSICQALGAGGEQLVSKAKAVCKCLPKALELSTSSLFQSIKAGNLDPSVAGSNAIHDYNKLQKCMVDNGFSVKDNKAYLFQGSGALSPQGNWTILRAAEIDLTTYGDLSAALAPCATPAGCQPQLIKNFVIRYLEDSKKEMGDQLTVVLKGWTNILGNADKKVGKVADAARDLASHLKRLPHKIEEVKHKVCRGNNDRQCADRTTKAYLAQVAKAISAVERLAKVDEAASNIAKTTPKLIKLIENTIKAAEAKPDLEYIISLARQGKLRKVQDILQAFRGAAELPKLVADLQRDGKIIIDFVAKYGGRGAEIQQVLRLVDEVSSARFPRRAVSSNSTTEPETEEPSDSANLTAPNSPDYKIDGRNLLVKETQKLIRQELQAPLLKLANSIRDLENILDTIPILSKGRITLTPGVASYQRWSLLSSFDLVCQRSKTVNFNLAGLHKSFSYPELYRCPYKGPNRLPWPNHHIPFIKFRLA